MTIARSRRIVTCGQCGSSRGVWRPQSAEYLCESCSEELTYLESAVPGGRASGAVVETRPVSAPGRGR